METIVIPIAERIAAGDNYAAFLKSKGYDWRRLMQFSRTKDVLVYCLKVQ